MFSDCFRLYCKHVHILLSYNEKEYNVNTHLESGVLEAGSELNTSVGGVSQSHQPLERRVAWLEEDVAVIHRRVKLECGEIGPTETFTIHRDDINIRYKHYYLYYYSAIITISI